MKPKLLILLGAGASAGYGPSTDWLTRRLLEPGAGVEGALLFRRLEQVLRKRRAETERKRLWGGLTVPPPNFEELIEAVDGLMTHLEADSLLTPFLRISRSLAPLKPDRNRYRRYASRARQFVLRQVRNYCERQKDPAALPLNRALSALAEVCSLRLMSLNYDLMPAASGIDFCTGFVDGDEPHQTFSPTHPWPEDRHVWCQLHGSLLFRVQPNEGIVRYKTVREAMRQRWVDNAHWGRYQDGHSAGLSPIITGLRKADALLNEPFATYAHQLREEALSCDRWLIIGYGGGDRHITEMLWEARRHWSRSGRPHRILVVGYWAERSRMSFTNLVFQHDSMDWGGDMSIFLFDESDYLDPVARHARFEPFNVSHWTANLALTLDGTDWAMGEGLAKVREFLQV